MGLFALRLDPELVIWLVVVGFTLFTQMARTNRQRPRRQAPGAPPPRQTTSLPIPATDAQQDIEDFIRSLTGAPPTERETPPLDMQVPEERPLPVARKIAPPPPLGLQPMFEPEREPARKQSQKKVNTKRRKPLAPAYVSPLARRPHGLNDALAADLSNAAALRKAIVLREIFDPPIALRRPTGA